MEIQPFIKNATLERRSIFYGTMTGTNFNSTFSGYFKILLKDKAKAKLICFVKLFCDSTEKRVF